MNIKIKVLIFLMIIIFLTTLSCNLPGAVSTSPDIQDQVEQTVQAQFTVESIAATLESLQTDPTEEAVNPTETVQPLLTQEPGDTFTATITLTPTPDVPMVSVSLDTNCRFGPHVVYDYLGALLEGETAEVVGRHTSGAWILINNPDRDGSCWITTTYATIIGETNTLPIAEIPPFYDWTGVYITWIGEIETTFPMTLTQNGINVSGELVTPMYIAIINGTLSENGQVLSGNIKNDYGFDSPFRFKMLNNMNQLQGSITTPDIVDEMCSARNGAGKPSPCMWP